MSFRSRNFCSRKRRKALYSRERKSIIKQRISSEIPNVISKKYFETSSHRQNEKNDEDEETVRKTNGNVF